MNQRQNSVRRSVALLLADGSIRRITPNAWRVLKERHHAFVVCNNPFTVRLRACATRFYRRLYLWTERSAGASMMGGPLMRRLPGRLETDLGVPEWGGRKR